MEGYIEEAKRGKQEIIASIEVGDNIPFGKYLWRVLKIKDGKALLLSDRIIENRKYNESNTNVTWETCTLRRYLNEEFYNSFSASEKAMIAETRISNNKNPRYGTNGGNDTNDKIFLLSLEEVVKYFGDSGQLNNISERKSLSDQYNSARIAQDGRGTATWWWLRSPGSFSAYAANVLYDGTVDVFGDFVRSGSGGVRPALWMNL